MKDSMDEPVIVFSKKDIECSMPRDCNLTLEEACDLIRRKFESSIVFEQITMILEEKTNE